MALKIRYRNPRRPGEAGVKVIPDQLQRAAEKEILEGLGFIVLEIAPTLRSGTAPGRYFPRT